MSEKLSYPNFSAKIEVIKKTADIRHVKLVNEFRRFKNGQKVDIEELSQKKIIAPWIGSYMHSLRIFGNEMVHSKLSNVDCISSLSAIRALINFFSNIRRAGMKENKTEIIFEFL